MALTIKQMLSMTKKELILAIEGLEAENQELIHLLADVNAQLACLRAKAVMKKGVITHLGAPCTPEEGSLIQKMMEVI